MKLRLPKCVTAWLAERMRAVMLRDPDQSIGPPDKPYMLRWQLFRKYYIAGVYLHLFLEDDDDRAIHDHPWWSVSFVLGGEMREIYSERGWNPADPTQHSARMIRAGDIVWRSPTFSHRIELRTETAMTLFIVGPHIREWGFHCLRGWRHWREYADPTNPNAVGRGCD